MTQTKTILVINDNSAEAEHAAKYALSVAQQTNADLLLANTFNSHTEIIERVVSGSALKNTGRDYPAQYLTDSLVMINAVNHSGFNPEIREIDISGHDEFQLSMLINKKEIWMIFKGRADTLKVPLGKKLNPDYLLKKSTLSDIICSVDLALEGYPRVSLYS